jgi:hypothetical protein
MQMTTNGVRPTVCVPFVPGMLRSETERAVLEQWPVAYLFPIDPNSPSRYARLLIELWREPGDLVIVEQDVVPPEGSIRRLFECDYAWCTHPMYHGGERKIDLLGLAKFSAGLKAMWPHAFEAALHHGVGGSHRPHWRSCDTLIARWLRIHKLEPHVHGPDAVHLKYRAPVPDMKAPPQSQPGAAPSDVSCDG